MRRPVSNPAPSDWIWLEQQWEAARLSCRQAGSWLLVLDEIQKVPRWSELTKRMWDQDSAEKLDLRVLVLVRLRF